MELKYEKVKYLLISVGSSNRTIMELKFTKTVASNGTFQPSNRTIMELKCDVHNLIEFQYLNFQSHHHGIEIHKTARQRQKSCLLPIAPSWN